MFYRFRSLLVFWLCLGMLGLGWPGRAVVRAAEPAPVILEWQVPPVHPTVLPSGAAAIAVAGYAQLDRPGQPALPFTTTLLASPSGMLPILEILEIEQTDLALPVSLALVAPPAGPAEEVWGDGQTGAGADLPLPPAPVEVQPVGWARGVFLVRVRFFPVLPIADHLRLVTHLRVAVRFPAIAGAVPSAPAEAAWLAEVRSLVANPADVRAQASPALSPIPAPAAEPAAFVEVETPGLTRLTYADLAAIDFAGGDPRYLQLWCGGREIAMQWEGDADTDFEPGEFFLFYAEPRFSRWTAREVYRLTLAATPGLRMDNRPAITGPFPVGSPYASALFETNAIYMPVYGYDRALVGRDGDRWMGEQLIQAPKLNSRAYAFALPAVESSQPATLTVWLVSYTALADIAPDHRAQVALNGSVLGETVWDGRQALTYTVAITPGRLAASNTLSLTLPGLSGISVEGMWLDAFALDYARGPAPAGARAGFAGGAAPALYTVSLTDTTGLRAYDITDPARPSVLAQPLVNGAAVTLSDPAEGGPRRYAVLAEAGIQTPAVVRRPYALTAAPGADYLVIAHPDFAAALEPLLALRRSQGLTVTVENVLALYDVFGDGRLDPAAIRAYLANAYAAWSPRPTYVLLVGDGTFDPRRYRASSAATFIPPYLADVDPEMGETAADNLYVAVEGADHVPDMWLGRLPVNTLAEAQAVVDKLVAYETWPALGGWNGRVTLVADDADTAGDFAARADQLAALIPAPYITDTLYYLPPSTSITDTRQAIFSRWNSGTGLLVYTGHSSMRQWAVERFVHMDDVSQLVNRSRLPVVVELTCFTGYFQDAGLSTLDETLLRQPTGGAVAVWGATGTGLAAGHTILASGFLEGLYSVQVDRIGAATGLGKIRLAQTGEHLDLLDTFNLLGDPATRMSLTINPGYPVSLPFIAR